MLNLLCPAAICMNANKNFVPLHNDSLHVKLHPLSEMMQFSVEVVINNRLASPSGVNAPVWEILDLATVPIDEYRCLPRMGILFVSNDCQLW